MTFALTHPTGRAKARHMSASANWGSPPWVADGARFVLGRIDLDPASDRLWNQHVVKATQIITEEQDALDSRTSWDTAGGRTFLNPPGDQSGELVKAFWDRLVLEWIKGRVHAGFYVGFSLEQLGTLQANPQGVSPLSRQALLCVPRARVRYLKPIENPLIGLPYEEGDAPTHGSFFCLLPARGAEGEAQLLRWREWCATVGATNA